MSKLVFDTKLCFQRTGFSSVPKSWEETLVKVLIPTKLIKRWISATVLMVQHKTTQCSRTTIIILLLLHALKYFHPFKTPFKTERAPPFTPFLFFIESVTSYLLSNFSWPEESFTMPCSFRAWALSSSRKAKRRLAGADAWTHSVDNVA